VTPIRKGTATRLGLRRPNTYAAYHRRWLIGAGSVVFEAPPVQVPGLPWRRTKKRLERNMQTMGECLNDALNRL
jgi:hypothetical protein